MQLKKFQVASVIACTAALMAFAAGAAQAAVTVLTQAASPVTPTTATLNGTLSPGGRALSYYFEYGLASKAGFSSQTATASIGTGNTTAFPVLGEVTGLKPKTKYKFELVATTAATAYTAPASVIGGALTFTTGGPGTVSLTSTKLKVKKSRIVVKFKCASVVTCSGKVKITAKDAATKKTVACGSGSFTIQPGDKLTVDTSKVSARCAALLTAASNKTIKAKLTAKFTTLQPELSKTVKLTS